MSEIKTGGPAFPVLMNWEGGEPIQGAQTGNSTGYFPGLSMRDYFAAKALQGILASPDERSIQGGTADEVEAMRTKWIEQDAMAAYRYSDAMLKAREAKP
jgi:hypothetical protein